MKDEWQDPEFAARWDQKTIVGIGNPTRAEQVALPPATYSIVFSVQALHHLRQENQQKLYGSLFNLLPPGGVFLLNDRIALDPAPFADLYRSAWNRLERVSEAKSDLSGDDFLHQLEDKEDHPGTLEEHLTWLRQAGFEATCLHMHLNRALIAGVKWK